MSNKIELSQVAVLNLELLAFHILATLLEITECHSKIIECYSIIPDLITQTDVKVSGRPHDSYTATLFLYSTLLSFLYRIIIFLLYVGIYFLIVQRYT